MYIVSVIINQGDYCLLKLIIIITIVLLIIFHMSTILFIQSIIVYSTVGQLMAKMLWQHIYEIFIYIIYTGQIIIVYSQCDYQSQLYFFKENYYLIKLIQ